MERVDAIDVQILQLLQDQGRMKRNRIAEAVGLSVPAVSDRMRKLEGRGVIQGYNAVVAPRRVGFDISAFIRVQIDQSTHYAAFVAKAEALHEVQEVHSITGEGSHILRVLVRNTQALEQLLGAIQSWPGVHGTSTSIVLSSFKDTRSVPVEPYVINPS